MTNVIHHVHMSKMSHITSHDGVTWENSTQTMQELYKQYTELNENFIEFFLLTQTWRVIKLSQAKLLQQVDWEYCYFNLQDLDW